MAIFRSSPCSASIVPPEERIFHVGSYVLVGVRDRRLACLVGFGVELSFVFRRVYRPRPRDCRGLHVPPSVLEELRGYAGASAAHRADGDYPGQRQPWRGYRRYGRVQPGAFPLHSRQREGHRQRISGDGGGPCHGHGLSRPGGSVHRNHRGRERGVCALAPWPSARSGEDAQDRRPR